MIRLKTQEEIEVLKQAGAIHARVLDELANMVAPGVAAIDLDTRAREIFQEMDASPAFLDYTPEGVSYPYPAAVCISINEEVVHGIPLEGIVFKQGDIVSIDVGVSYKGMITDAAVTVPVGEIDSKAQHLLDVTKTALKKGIEAARLGNTVGDIGHAIESFATPQGVGIIRILAGHGVGYSVHEDPYVPNYGNPGEGEELQEGMVIAIEPMFTLGAEEVAVCEDEYTYVTADDSLSAHFEHTIVITKDGPLILTALS
jgi:methionyl aminopeptidase